jgi:serine/threonine protein phosphatase 1
LEYSKTENTGHSDKYIAIGDIHGCARSLKALLEKTRPFRDRTHVFIGDYIDRGPDSKGVVDYVIEFSRDHHCVFLRGNHEKMVMDAIRSGERTFWMINGGMETLDSYQVHDPAEIPGLHQEFFEQTRLWHETPDYLFIHAGLDPGLGIQEQLESPNIESTALWERRHVQEPVTWEKPVVFGHTPVREPLIEDRKLGIDTGCVFTSRGFGYLTALLLPEKTAISQECLDHLP